MAPRADKNSLPTLLSIAQVAEHLGIHQVTVRAWIREGRLTAVRVGPRFIRIDAAEVAALITRDAVGA